MGPGSRSARVAATGQPSTKNQNSNFKAFGGGGGAWPVLRGLPGSLWVLEYPYCHQMTTQTHPRGNKRILEKIKNSKNFQCSGANLKMAKSSRARAHRCEGSELKHCNEQVCSRHEVTIML